MGRRIVCIDQARSAVSTAGLAALLAASGTGVAASQQPEAAAEPSPELPPGRYLGAASCGSSNCHGRVDPVAGGRVLQDEYLVWLDSDPHALAYGALFDEESELIARNLRLEAPASESRICLDCHTLNVPHRLQENRIDLDEGVSCEACHGPASGWLAGHTSADWTHQESVRRGMRDLRRIPSRAGVCMGCHLGDESRKVDHELIAAGHPELLFELDNFTGAIPPHWAPYGPMHREAGRRDTHGVRAWAVGQVAAFQAALEQLARRALSDRWPEFADMSCFACHHSLEESRWRRERGFALRAGLPPWSPARWVVLRQLAKRVSAAELERLDAWVAELATSVAYMNRPEETARLARELATALEPLLAAVERSRFTRADANELLRAISGDTEYLERTDVQSAEQAFLAVNSLVSYLAGQDPSVLDSELAGLVERLDQEIVDRYRFEWSRFSDYLAQVADSLP